MNDSSIRPRPAVSPAFPNRRRAGLSRRSILRGGLAAAGLTVLPRHLLAQSGATPPSEQLVLGCIGIGGQGGGVINNLLETGKVRLGALCDVDSRANAGLREAHSEAKFYADYRELLANEDGLDAVVICTPDHTHAPPTMMAMRKGLHVYVEKPMSHTIAEARLMTELARERGVVTQMGNQGHAGEGLRLTREWIQAGVIGKVREVHVWSDRPGRFWNTQGMSHPEQAQPVPEHLNWDLWQGPAPERDFHSVYAPRTWRGWWDYGCGALGDMAVHNADPAFYALDLGAPSAVEAESAPHEGAGGSFPEWSVVTWWFPARGDQPEVKMVWHDGGKMPPLPPGSEPDRELPDNGIYFVGDDGVILCGGWSGTPRLVPEAKMRDFRPLERTIERSIGHRAEWVEACLAGKPEDAHAGFHYSGPFTEALLVGLLPLVAGGRVEWDAETLTANVSGLEEIINKPYRNGFGIEG